MEIIEKRPIIAKIYSNAEPDFEEDDVFRLIVPMRFAGATLTSDEKSNAVTEKV